MIRKNNGVTLVELLIVIIVMGIISAVAVVKVGQIIRNVKYSAINNELHTIQDAARFYDIDVGERPYGTVSGAGTCATWNQDSINTFVLGTRNGSDIDGWTGPYVQNWEDETPVGGCYVYRSYKVGSQSWAGNNWLRYSDNETIGSLHPSDKDMEIIMIRFYPLNDADAIALSREVADFLEKHIDYKQIYHVNGQAVIGYYILPRD